MSTFSVSGPKILSHIMPRSADDDTVIVYIDWHLTDIVYYDYRDAFAAKKSFLVQKYLKYCQSYFKYKIKCRLEYR